MLHFDRNILKDAFQNCQNSHARQLELPVLKSGMHLCDRPERIMSPDGSLKAIPSEVNAAVNLMVSNEKNTATMVVCWVYVGDEILHSCMGIIS